MSRSSELPWCVAGDFNDLTTLDEKRGGYPQPRFLLEGYSQTLSECGLSDLVLLVKNILGKGFEEGMNGFGNGWIEALHLLVGFSFSRRLKFECLTFQRLIIYHCVFH